MRTIKLLTILIVLAIGYGCREQEGVFTGKEKYGLKFKREQTFPPGNPLFELSGGQSLQIIDTLLLVQYQHANPSYYWDVYSLTNLKHLKSILRQGRGPNEVLFAHYAGQYEIINDDLWMFFFDTTSAKFLKVNLSESIRSGNDIIELVSPIDREKFPYFAINDSTFIYCGYNPDKGYLGLMTENNFRKEPVTIKKIYKDTTLEDFYKLSHSLYYNAKNKKLCVIPYYVNHIQIIDLEGDSDILLSTANSDNWPALQKENISESTIIYYGSTRITEDYIFALYTNKKISEMENIPEETEIHIFNWDGEAIAKILLGHNLISFAVDAKNKILYGLNGLEQVYAYDISSCLDSLQQ